MTALNKCNREEERLFTIKGNTEKEQSGAKYPLIPLTKFSIKPNLHKLYHVLFA